MSWSLLTLYDGGRGAPSGLKLRFNGEVVVQLIIYFVQIRVNAWHANQPNCLTWSDVSTDAEIRCNSKRERERERAKSRARARERERERVKEGGGWSRYEKVSIYCEWGGMYQSAAQ